MNKYVEATENYLRKQLKQYSKEEIIDALFAKFSYAQIDMLQDGLRVRRVLNHARAENERLDKEAERIKSAVDEYNQLVEKAKRVGMAGMSNVEIDRMCELLKIITKV